MKFAVKARVLLELGGELISSDAIALYELIKNAIDAGSPKIEVRVVSHLTHSGYQALDEDIERQETARLSRSFLEQNISRYFDTSIDEDVVASLIDSLAGLSLSGARKKLREFYVAQTYIEIEDWGHGMSREDIETKFLTIGTTHRERQRAASQDGTTPILGEKGIGRLSAMRLGRLIEMKSSTRGEARRSRLYMDWSTLTADPEQELEEFEVDLQPGEVKDRATAQGTLIRIADLQNDWSLSRVTDLARVELSKIQNPFDRKSERLDLRLFYNGVLLKDAIQEIDTEWMKYWHGHLKVDFDYDVREDSSKRPRLTGVVRFRVPEKQAEEEGQIDAQKINCVGDTAFSPISNPDQPLIADGVIATSGRFAGIATLGPFTAEGYWFNRQRMRSELEGTGRYDEFNDWLKQWGGGLLVYRDGFRVYPYADPDDDWLHLDQRALRRRSFKLNRGQFVGHVAISSRRNRFLKDQTNRQGLVDSPEKRALVEALQYAIWNELGSLVRKYELKSVTRALSSVQEIDRNVKEKSKDARSKLREIARRAPSQAGVVQELRSHIDELELAWSKAKSTIKQQQVQADVYLHLAGVGILLEFIIHDLTRATTHTLNNLKDMDEAKLSPTYKALFQQLKTLERRLRVLDPVSTPGRQRKEVTDIPSIIGILVDAHEDQFERHKIRVVWKPEREKARLEAKVVAGQMYQVFENLIANSVYWLAHQRAVQAETRRIALRFTPTITIEVDARERTVCFTDNGPGIDPADAKKVFEPFFSKKPDGRGIGLYIVRSLCAENNIETSLIEEDEREVHPGFLFTFPGAQ